MLKFYQKKKTSQVPVGKRKKIGTAFWSPIAPMGRIAPRVELPFASKGAGRKL